ncbi:MAG: SDR family NAD(P)-dependent oxidoreductase [Myxococcota bacterium]
MELRGEVVVLTGASRGLGVAIAQRLAARGAHLVLAARAADGLERVAAQVREAGGEATVVACDVTQAADRERLVAAASEVGPIAVLVNNAGVEMPGPFVDASAADVDQQVAVNLLAPVHLTHAVLPGMVARRKGVVVQVSSMSGKAPTPYNAVYAATKYGLNGFTGSIRIELEGTGVHAGVVCPGFVADTGMWADSGGKAPAMMREVSPERVADGVAQVIDGAVEVLVTPGPMRPALALAQLAPRLDGFVLKRFGVLDVLKQRGPRGAE